MAMAIHHDLTKQEVSIDDCDTIGSMDLCAN